MERTAGILMPISSLPGKYGIGCFNLKAYEFVDFLRDAGQTYWQILPIHPTSYGDSPYQSFSTFAGNPYFIDLEALIAEGVLSNAECDSVFFGDEAREKSARADTLLHLMLLGTGLGDTVTVSIEGIDKMAASIAMRNFFWNNL